MYRDGGREQRLQPVSEEGASWGCIAIGYCSIVFPKRIDPARAINMNGIESTMDYFPGFIALRGGTQVTKRGAS